MARCVWVNVPGEEMALGYTINKLEEAVRCCVFCWETLGIRGTYTVFGGFKVIAD